MPVKVVPWGRWTPTVVGVEGVKEGVVGLSGRAIVVGKGNWEPIELRFACAMGGLDLAG